MHCSDWWAIFGLSLNFIGALLCGLFSTHGTSQLWNGISCRGKILIKGKHLVKIGYLLFVSGFGIQICAILLK
jgi:hypothetical protein